MKDSTQPAKNPLRDSSLKNSSNDKDSESPEKKTTITGADIKRYIPAVVTLILCIVIIYYIITAIIWFLQSWTISELLDGIINLFPLAPGMIDCIRGQVWPFALHPSWKISISNYSFLIYNLILLAYIIFISFNNSCILYT